MPATRHLPDSPDPEQLRRQAKELLRAARAADPTALSRFRALPSLQHASDDDLFPQRCVHVKEERAELAKHHIDVLWHDYFKPEHVEKYPDLHDVCWKASKAASKVKQTLDQAAAEELLSLIDRIDEMWKATGGLEKTRLHGRPA